MSSEKIIELEKAGTGAKLRQILKLPGVTVFTIARDTGLSRRAIYNYLEGQPISKYSREKIRQLYELLVLSRRKVRKPKIRRAAV